jgi:hypothetical protein
MDAFIKANVAYKLDSQAEVLFYNLGHQDPDPRVILLPNLIKNQLELEGLQDSFYRVPLLWINFLQDFQQVFGTIALGLRASAFSASFLK